MRSHYGIQARLMPLGTPGTPAQSPARHVDGEGRLLAFGRFGSYKRLEIVVDAVRELAGEGTDVRLTIAGSDSRQSPGYLAALQQQCRDIDNIEFVGDVPESNVPSLFRAATACVLPYATVAGMSSVATQAAMYRRSDHRAHVAGVRLFEKRGAVDQFLRMAEHGELEAGHPTRVRVASRAPPQCVAQSALLPRPDDGRGRQRLSRRDRGPRCRERSSRAGRDRDARRAAFQVDHERIAAFDARSPKRAASCWTIARHSSSYTFAGIEDRDKVARIGASSVHERRDLVHTRYDRCTSVQTTQLAVAPSGE